MYKEGKAIIRYTSGSFLNPEALVSRDISVAFARALAGRKSSILDSTSATGIRGIRYFLETPSKKVTFLEMNRSAYASLKKNVGANRVKADVLNCSIQEFANSSKEKFDIIDLDPFGGVTPYIYDLMKISKGGTCLFVTATDGAVLCGADYRACLRLYDARPMHNELCQEVGLRLLIGYIARMAAQFNFGIDVLGSFSHLHYMRAFIRLRHGSGEANRSVKQLGYVHYCNRCLDMGIERSAFPSSSRCSACGAALDISGKVWLGSLKDGQVMKSALDNMRRMKCGDKSIMLAESLLNELDVPLYYSIPKFTKKMGIGSVSMGRLAEMLGKRGFASSRTHMSSLSIKSDVSPKELKAMIKKLSKHL